MEIRLGNITEKDDWLSERFMRVNKNEEYKILAIASYDDCFCSLTSVQTIITTYELIITLVVLNAFKALNCAGTENL